MADAVSIVMKMNDDITSKLKSIASTAQGCSKEFEELQRKTRNLAERYEAFNRQAAETSAKALSVKRAMDEASRAFRKSGEEADRLRFEQLKEQYQSLTDSAKGYSQAAQDTQREMRNTYDEMRKLSEAEDSGPDTRNTGGSERRTSGNGGSIQGMEMDMAFGQMIREIGGSISESTNVLFTSVMGEQAGSLVGTALSGVASGLEAGQFLGEAGELLGFEGLSGLAGAGGMAALGLISGLISAGTQMFEDYDNAFKDYYGGLYDAAGEKTAESLSSGSGLAAGRETTKLSFNTLLGGEEAAEDFLGDVLETANTTPFLYDDLVDISKTMLSFNTAVDDVIPTLTKVGDAGAALGLSTGDMGTIATYLGRMQSSNKAFLEYLNPLSERGFSVFQWLADDLGISIAEVYDKISKSELSGNYVSDVILAQFEKLYGGMMETQSKSTEGLDSTLQGLKENVDAAGGEGYNRLRNESKEADIAAYSGALGDKLAELSAITGEVQAYSENLRDQYQREALNAVLLGDLDKGNTVFSEEDAAKLEGLAAEFSEAEEAYKSGSLEAGQKMTDLREEAESLATAAYESSQWAQSLQEAELEQIAATRELTAGLAANTNALRTSDERSKGVLSTRSFWDGLSIETSGANSRAKINASDDSNMRKLKSLGLYAYGLDYVPYDEFPALLHQGERVLTAEEARELDRGVLAGAAAFGADKPARLEDWAEGRYAFGLNAAPYEGFPALLHQGERVQSPESRNGSGINVTIQVGEMHIRQESDIDAIAEALAERLETAMLRGGG